MNHNTEPKKIEHHTYGVAAGIILILVGLSILLSHFLVLDLGVYLMLLLGLGMLAWGAFSHSQGWIIPGGILTGIGTGALIFNSPWQIASEYQPGIFLLCFALGWFLIPLFTGLFTSCMRWWPFIPGGIMAVIGSALLLVRGSMQETVVTVLQAALLILAGLYLILRQKRNG
jgi:hypothetical protein